MDSPAQSEETVTAFHSLFKSLCLYESSTCVCAACPENFVLCNDSSSEFNLKT